MTGDVWFVINENGAELTPNMVTIAVLKFLLSQLLNGW
jgi:hypothetical protein